MRILYGVVGEGMGHATRSRVVLQHLTDAGHDVHIMVSGRAHDMLVRHFDGVHRIHGWHLVYEDNEVKKARTLFSNLEALAAGLPRNVAAYFALIDAFQPEVVISDFESWTWLYGQLHRVPVVSIDNMQIINRCTHPDEVLDGRRNEFLLSKGIVKSKLPGCRRYLVSTFFWPEVRKARTTLVPPILRPEVLAAQPAPGDHVLVYQSSDDAPTLEAALKQVPHQTFLVYGLRRGIQTEEVDTNLRHQPFSEGGFIAHLASARAVVAGGGFSLLSEAVYLHKPVLAVPVAGQFEQVLNARWLERLGYGLCREMVDAEAVEELLGRRDELAGHLQAYAQTGNTLLFAAIDDELAAIHAG